MELVADVRGGGGIFGVPKSEGRVRPVWNGTRVSEAALAPPKPEHLTGVAALTKLETEPSKPFYFSKRDGRSMFDQLRAPACCRPFFGQPAFKVGDYMDEVGGTLVGDRHTWVVWAIHGRQHACRPTPPRNGMNRSGVRGAGGTREPEGYASPFWHKAPLFCPRTPEVTP